MCKPTDILSVVHLKRRTSWPFFLLEGTVVQVKKILVISIISMVVIAMLWAFGNILPTLQSSSISFGKDDEHMVLEPYSAPTPEGPIPYTQILGEKESAW